jgi:elongation factor P--beta-lysine ligase
MRLPPAFSVEGAASGQSGVAAGVDRLVEAAAGEQAAEKINKKQADQ